MPQQFHQSEEPAPLQTDAVRYTPGEIKEILAEAERLQAYHQKTLSQSDVEAIGQDVGIDAEFVRRAMEQAGAAVKSTPRRKLSVPRPQPLPFRAVATTAVLPLIYACLLLPITLWQHSDGLPSWFLFLFMVLPPLLAFSTGFVRKRIRLSASSGAFWGLAVLFLLALPNAIKLCQNLDNVGPAGFAQTLSETGMILVLFLLYGAAFGVGGALTRRGVEKSVKWLKARNAALPPYVRA